MEEKLKVCQEDGMRLTLNLSLRYDKDLIALSASPDMDFNRTVRSALSAYAKGQVYSISAPSTCSFEDCNEDQNEKKHSSKTYQIYITESKNPEIVTLISKVKARCVNLFVKCVLRSAMVGDIAYIYLKPESETAIEPISTGEKEEKSDPYSNFWTEFTDLSDFSSKK